MALCRMRAERVNAGKGSAPSTNTEWRMHGDTVVLGAIDPDTKISVSWCLPDHADVEEWRAEMIASGMRVDSMTMDECLAHIDSTCGRVN